MANIYLSLYDIFSRIYSSKENSHIRVRPEIREFLYIRHGIEIGEIDRCSIRTKIDGFNNEEGATVDIVFLNEEQMNKWKGRYNYTPFDLVENYIGRFKTHLVIYVPEFTLYINNDYEPMKRLSDLAGILNIILNAYFRSSMILQKEKTTMCLYGSLVIALKILFDLRICRIDDFEGKEIELLDRKVLLKNLKEIDCNSIKDLLINKVVEEIFRK